MLAAHPGLPEACTHGMVDTRACGGGVEGAGGARTGDGHREYIGPRGSNPGPSRNTSLRLVTTSTGPSIPAVRAPGFLPEGRRALEGARDATPPFAFRFARVHRTVGMLVGRGGVTSREAELHLSLARYRAARPLSPPLLYPAAYMD